MYASTYTHALGPTSPVIPRATVYSVTSGRARGGRKGQKSKGGKKGGAREQKMQGRTV